MGVREKTRTAVSSLTSIPTTDPLTGTLQLILFYFERSAVIKAGKQLLALFFTISLHCMEAQGWRYIAKRKLSNTFSLKFIAKQTMQFSHRKSMCFFPQEIQINNNNKYNHRH